jgi:RNA polymerase sigma factor (sigma-70 family)
MTDPGRPVPSDAEITEFSKTLGPYSERQLERPEHRDAVRDRVKEGRSLQDAVLAVVHGLIAEDRRIADEFAAYFLLDLMKMGKVPMASTSRLRRFLDTGDLVNSVFGDLWGDLTTLRFDTGSEFKALFVQRMRWKAADQARKYGKQQIAGEPVLEADAEITDRRVDDAPLQATIREEEKQQLILILLRLKPRDRKLLTLHLRDVPLTKIAEEMNLNYDAARKALSRAITQARSLAAASGLSRRVTETPATTHP